MNANELADLIGLCGDGGYNQDAATMLRQQQVDLKIADDYSYILERKLKEAQAEIEALKKVLQEVVRISDRNHDAWNKAKELLK